MDTAFFCIPAVMMRKLLIPLTICGLMACNDKEDDSFALQPPAGSTYQLTIETEEELIHSKKTMEFTLQTGPADSFQHFNFIVKKIAITQPESEMVSGKKGEIIVRPTGRLEMLSTHQSNNGANKEWYNYVSRIIGDSIQVTMNRLGEKTAMDGYANIKNKIIAATGHDPRNVAPILRNYIGPEVMTDLIGQLFFYLPDRKIHLGDHWVKNIVLIEKSHVKYSHLIKVEDITGDTVKLSVQTEVSARMGDGGTLYVEGKLSGKVIASYSTGMPVNLEMHESSVMHTNYEDRKTERIVRASLRQSPLR